MESILMSCEKISIKVVEKLIIQNISLAVNKNQIVGLLGPNGAGKTSTFYAIAGIVKIDSGKILFQENEIHNLPIHKRANHGLAYLPQEPSLFSDLSVIENLNGISELSKQPNLMTVDEIIHTFNLKKIINDFQDKKFQVLIGTQMISKGFNFPKLNCIVVIDADFSGKGYDLRATEKNIQLYNQLSGRAGRFSKDSIIIYQTFNPKDETLKNKTIKY